MTPDKLARYSKEISALKTSAVVCEKFAVLKMEAVASDRDKTMAALNRFEAVWMPVIKKAALKCD
jgi:hypothetical protein